MEVCTMDLTFQEQVLYTQAFKSVFKMLPQDKGSKLLSHVTVENGLKGEGAVASDQIGKTDVNEVTDRYGDSPHNEVEMKRRWYTPRQFDWGHLFERADKVRTLGDPQNQIAVSAKNAFGRKIDDVIIESFFGTNKTGKAGGTNTTFDANNVIAHGSAGFTITKLEEAKEKFRKYDVDIDNEHPLVVLSPKAERQLFNETKYASRDYGEPVLDKGILKSFLGFDFVVMNRLPFNTSSNVRSCPCFVKSAVGLGIWEDLIVELSKRDDKKFLWYLYMNQMYSATRLYEEGCLKIEVSEA